MSESAQGPEQSPVQDFTLQVKVPDQINGGGLKQLRRELEKIDVYLGKIQGRFQDVTRKSFATTGVDGFKAKLEAAFKAAGNTVNLNVREMAKQLDLLGPKFEGIFGRYRKNNTDSFRTKDTAASPTKLAEFFNHLEQRYQRREFATGQLANRAFRNALYGGAAGPAVNPRVSEVQQVSVNHDRLIAALDRLTVAVETKGVAPAAAAATGGTATAKSGPFTAEDDDRSASERRSRKLATGERVVTDPQQGPEAQRRVAQMRGSKFSTVIRQIMADNQVIDTTFDRKGNAKKVVTTTNAAQKVREDFLDKWQGEMDVLGKSLPKQRKRRSASDLLNLSAAYEKSAGQLEGELKALSGDDRKLLGRGFVRKVNKAIGDLRNEAQVVLGLAAEAEQAKPSLQAQRRNARDLMAAIRAAQGQDRAELRTDDRNQAAKNRARAKVQDAVAAAAEARAEVAAGNARTAQLQFTRQQADALMADLKSAGYRRGADSSNRSFSEGGSGERKTFSFTKDEGGRRVTQQFTEIYKNGRLATVQVQTLGKELKALNRGVDSGKGFLENTEHITRWALSVGTLYGSLALARSGLRAFLDLSYEVARLDQVYQKQGGTTRALADDVLALAAANGRTSQEALQSATSWARLGLTRLQINEAVRVSLMAANVAELDTLEATKFLQSTMAAYGLQVREVSGFLAGLNDISNKFNVTNADLLEGISKVANVARQAGIPLAELRGLIGAAVGTTGQSGANIGNALKSVIVALSNPVLQKTLKSEFGLDMVSPKTGDLMDFSQVLAELYLRYQDLNDAERQNLLFQTAGKTQASKLAGMLDSYIKAQMLAANSLLHLNSAEEENAKIKQTLRAELTGLVTEFDRFALKMGGSGPAQGIGMAAASLKNLLTVLQLPGVSTGLMVVVTLLGALTARLLLTKAALDTAGAKVGWFDKSLRNVGDRARNTWLGVGSVIRGVAKELEMAGGQVSALGRGLRVTDYYLRLMKREGFAGMSKGAENFSGALALNNRRGLGGRLGQAGLGLGRMAVSGAVAAGGVGGRLLLGGALSIGVAIPQILAGMLAFGAATWGVNKAMSAMGLNTDRVDKLFGGFTADLNKAEAAAQAAGMQVKFLDTAIRALGSGRLRDPERGNILEALGGLDKIGGKPGEKAIDPADLEKLRQTGNATLETTAQDILGKYRRQAVNQRVALLQEVHTANGRRVAELEAEVPKIRDPQERARKETELLQAKGEQFRVLNAITEGDAADVGLGDEMKKTAQLERQKLILERIRDIYSSLGSVDPLTRYQAEADAAEAARRYAEADVAAGAQRLKGYEPLMDQARQQAAAKEAEALAIRNSLPTDFRNAKANEVPTGYKLSATFEQLANVEMALQKAADLESEAQDLKKTLMPTGTDNANYLAELAAQKARTEAAVEARTKAAEANDARKRLLAEQLANYEEAKANQRQDNQAFGVGDSEGERLADRQLKLEQQRVRLLQQADQGLTSLARQEQTILDLLEVENQLRERGATIQRDMAQARRDSDREFNRSFLEGDSTSRLKQLAALQAQKMGLTQTAGGYMALGDLQRYLPDADKPFGRMADLRRERDDLNGGVYGPQPGPGQRRGQLNDVRRRYLEGPGQGLETELTKITGSAAVAFAAVEKASQGVAVAFQAATKAALKFAETQGVKVEAYTAKLPDGRA